MSEPCPACRASLLWTEANLRLLARMSEMRYVEHLDEETAVLIAYRDYVAVRTQHAEGCPHA